jgi:hypothetical protein
VARNLNSLDPKLRSRIERDLASGKYLQKALARKYRLDIRWISEINVARQEREAAEDAAKADPEPATADTPVPEPEVEAEDDYLDKLRRKLRKAIPIAKRVEAIKALIDSPNAQLVKAGLDQLNQIEGVKDKAAKPYDPGPLFVIDTIPGIQPVKGPETDD